MFKRRKVKLSTTAKIILDDNEKTAKPSNSKETESKSAAISDPQAGQGVDCSPSCVKKPKLDSSQSSSPKRSMKYVPPFTASKRFSSRLRLKRIDKEKNESKSSCQEAVKCLEGGGKNICLEKAKENLQKGEERSATVLESNEDKTEYVKCFKSNEDGKDTVIQQGPQVSELAQQFNGLLLRSGRICEEMSMLENATKDNGNGGLKESKTCNLKGSSNRVDAHMSNTAVLKQTNKLDTNAMIGGVVSCNLDASLHTLADTCAKEEYMIDVLTVEELTDPSKISSNLRKGGEMKVSFSRKGTTVKDKNTTRYSNIMNVILPQHQEQRTDMTICSPSKVKDMMLVEHRITENMVGPQGVSGNGSECENVVTFATQDILNKPVRKSSCPEPKSQDTAAPSSQELIADKLSEMLSIISHNETNRPSSFENNESDNTSSLILTEYRDKCVDNPVVHTVMISTEQSSSSQPKQVRGDAYDMDAGNNLSNTTSEENVKSISFGNKNDNIKNKKIEGAAMNEKISVRTNSNNDSQNATTGNMVEDASKQLSSCALKESEVKDGIGCRVASTRKKHDLCKNNNDQEVPFEKASPVLEKFSDKMATALPQCKEKDVVKNSDKNTGDTHNTETPTDSAKVAVATPTLNSREHPTTGVTQNESKKVCPAKKVDVTTFNDILENQSFAEEFEALEKLLPKDDVGFFDDMILSQPNSISVDTEFTDGESTIEFLINEVNSLQCMVANHERAVEDIKRQYMPVRSWSTVNTNTN